MNAKVRPLLPLLVALITGLAATGWMEYARRGALEQNAALRAEVDQASRRVNELRARAKKLEETRPQRAQIESRLVTTEGDTHYRQLLDGVVTAAQRSGAVLDRLTFAAATEVGEFRATRISGTANGTDEQLRSFVERLETEKPLGRVEKINWSVPLSSKEGGRSGSISFQIVMLGPGGRSAK